MEDGGTGAVDLAEAVVTACENDGGAFRYLYPTSASVRDKVEAVCKEIYLAGEVTYSDLASHQIAAYEAQGLGDLPFASPRRSTRCLPIPQRKALLLGTSSTSERCARPSAPASSIYYVATS